MADVPAAKIVQSYYEQHFRPVFWPPDGDVKGPQDKGWHTRIYTLEDFHEGMRVGLLLGTETTPGKFLHDVDVDWAAGSSIASKLLPPTGFVFGRASKNLSHCFYLTPSTVPVMRFEDLDGTCLIELRGTKTNGEIGLQTMVPPSVWSKEGQVETLTFVRHGNPDFVITEELKRRVTLTAIGMLLARHFGVNGFGHETRLMWAGYLLRAEVTADELIKMGEGMSGYCNNLEVHDVRTSVIGTAQRLQDPKQKIKGGPALAKFIGKAGKAVLARIDEWLGRNQDFVRNPKTQVIIPNSPANIERVLTLMEIELCYDVFAEHALIREGEDTKWVTYQDEHEKDLYFRIIRDFHFTPGWDFFKLFMENLPRDNSFHPVRDYLDGLKWDGVPRINTWLTTYGGAEDSEYCQAVSAIVLMAAVRRIRQPGVKYDEMLVLESPQGLNKSSALRLLCPRDDWFSDDLPLNVDAKQVIERTLGKWIIEASDLVGGRQADRDHLKSMLSRQVDGPARMAYGHIPLERRRHFIIVGTTNSAAYLNDSTGARRFWPVKIKQFDLDKLKGDRDQLWAEAAEREARGDSIRLDVKLWAAAKVEQEQRQHIDPWKDLIEGLLEAIKDDPNWRRSQGRLIVSAERIWQYLGVQKSERDRNKGDRISSIMQQNGWTRQNITVNVDKTTGEEVPTGGRSVRVNGYIDGVKTNLLENKDE